MAELFGRVAAEEIQKNIKKRLDDLSTYIDKRRPRLAIVRIGERKDDLSYEKAAVKRLESLGMEAEVFAFEENISEALFKEELRKINDDGGNDGILLFAPLPKHINEKEVAGIISPAKDIDGLNPYNQAKVFMGDESGFAPCTAEAAVKLIKNTGINICGANVTVVGRSPVIGRPAAMLLLAEDATVTVCHSRTENLKNKCKEADILIMAAGKPKMVDASFIKDGAVVIDVGINFDADGNLCGDVDFESVSKTASFITPVPGGVGSVTTSVLASHLLRAYEIGLNKTL